jgi:pyroglutamyl-peptidase
MSRRILVTGFKKFLKNEINPTEVIVSDLIREGRDGKIIDVIYREAEETLNPEFLSSFDCVLSFGLASSRKEITVEKYAYNKLNTKVKDNAGAFKADGVAVEGGEERLMSKLKPEGLVSLLNESGLQSSLSTNPGNYLCDFVYYRALKLKEGSALFIHFPQFSSQWSEEKLLKAGQLALRYLENLQ